MQCEVCGKHLRAVKKDEVLPLGTLPAFDEELEKARSAAVRRWRQGLHEALKKARQEFRDDLVRRVATGEVQYVDASRFGTYYTSTEWQNTRSRMLTRDDHLCQACGAPATDVHHITYDRLGCENDLDLISLCAHCHSLIHERQDQAKDAPRLLPSEIQGLHMQRTPR